jgi:tape measure domain-containing protein
MRKAGTAGLPAFFESIAQYGKRAVSATAPTLGLDPGAFVADPEAAIRIASEAASKFASHKGPKTEAILSSIVEAAIREFATPEVIQPVAKKAAKGAASRTVEKAVETKVEQVAEAVAEAVTDPRATSMRRPESERFFKVNPRAIGTAAGSEKARSGGYVPYGEASEAQRGKYNMTLLGGYAELEKQYEEAQKEAEYMKENFATKPGATPHASIQKAEALRVKLTELRAVMIERGLAQPTMSEQIAELFTSPSSSSSGLTPTRTSGGGGGGGGGGRRRGPSGGGGGGEEEEKTPKWIQSFQGALAASGLDPQTLKYMTSGFKFGATQAAIEPGLFAQSRASLEALQQFAAVRQLSMVQMSRGLVGGGANGFWQPQEAGERGGIALGGFGARTAAPLLRTMIHEIAHGTFESLVAGGYKPQTKVEMYGPKGEALGPVNARQMLAPFKETTASGHVDPAFYRSQAMISKAGGALLPQLAFHRMVEEVMPQGHLTEGIGLGKFSQLLTPHLKEFASPEQSTAAEEFVKFSARIMEATNNFTQGGIGKGGALSVLSEGLQQLGASSKAFPSTFFLEAASVVGNTLKNLEAGDPENLTKVAKSLMNAAALTVGEGEFRPGVAVASNAAKEVANYLASASIEEKAAIALGANPKLLGDTSFNPGNEGHVQKVNEAIANISRVASETSRGVAVARFVGGQRVETPYAAAAGLLGQAAPGTLAAQTSPLQFPGGSLAQRMAYYGSQSASQRGMESAIPGAYLRAKEGQFIGMGPALQQAYSSARNRQELEAGIKSSAKSEYVQSANAAMRYAEVQSRLNLIVQNGNVNFSQLSRVLTDAGTGFTVSAANALKFAAAIAVGQQITGSIVGVFEHLKGGILGFNAMLESASVGFTTLFKNAGRSVRDAESETAKTITTLREFANVTNFRFGDLETAALRMQAFGFEVDTARAALKKQMPVLYEVNNVLERNATGLKTFRGALVNIGDAVAALGGEDDKLRRITYALGQMNSAGRVYQNDMMQLANAGIAGYDILAKALLQEISASPELKKANAAIYNKLMNPETAVEEVRRLAKSGRLFGPGAVQAILKGLEERYGGGMKAFSRTFQGAMTTVADTSQSLVATAFNPLFSVVRDLTIQLADFLQQPEAEAGAKNLAKAVLSVSNAIRTGLPSALSTADKILSSITGTFGSLAGTATEGTSSLGGFVRNTIKGLSTFGDVLENSVIRKFGSALVVAKLLFGFIAANPLLATLTAGTAGIGFLATAIQENQFGLGTAFQKIAVPLEQTLANLGNNIMPSLSNTLTAAAGVIGATIASIMTAISPLLEIILNVLNIVTSAVKPFSSVLGVALALFIGKKILIDGVASAMARFAMFTEKAAGSVDNMKMKWFAARDLQAFERFGSTTMGAQMVAPQYNKQGELTQAGKVQFGQFGGAGMGYSSPLLYKIFMAQMKEMAGAQGFEFQNLAGDPTGAEKLTLEATPIAKEQALSALSWLKGLKTSDPEKYKETLAAATPSERLQLEEAMNAGLRTVVSGLRAFKAELDKLPTVMQKLGYIGQIAFDKIGTLAGAATGLGLTLSTLGGLMNNEALVGFGSTLATVGIATSGLVMTFTQLKQALGPYGFAGAIGGAITALGLLAVAAFEDHKTKQDDAKSALSDLGSLQSIIGPDALQSEYGNLIEGLSRSYELGFDLTDEQKASLAAARERLAVLKAQIREDKLENYTGKGSAKYTMEKNKKTIKNYAIRGYTPEQIAEFTGMDLDYVKSLFKNMVQDGSEAGQEYIKILTQQLDATGEALQKAKDILEKATEAFERPLNRLMSRVQTLISELFADEKEKLQEESRTALGNIEVLYNGEMIRLGVLEEQHRILTEQRQEMEEMQRLEDLRTKASEAALEMFDAGTDPLERARAARDAARDLFSESEQIRLDQMGKTIEEAKTSVPYMATSEDYDLRIKALEVDQQERQRVLTETIDDLMRKVKNGKLSAEEAKKMLQDAFADTGLDLAVAAAQGYDFMEHFSSGFMDALEKNIDLTFKRLPALIAAAVKALREDSAYKKAQEELANILNPTPVDKNISGVEMAAEQKRLIERAKRTLQALQLAEKVPGQTDDQKNALVKQMSSIAMYISKLEKNPFAANLNYSESEKTLLTENFGTQTNAALGKLFALFGYDTVLDWVFGGVPMASRPGDINNRASGGAVGAGTYMVGERGPEMLQMFPNGGGYVVPNHKLPSGMRSSAAALGGGIMGRAWGGGVGPVNPEDPWTSRAPVVSGPTGGGINDWHDWGIRFTDREGMKYSFDWGDVVIDEDAYENIGEVKKFLEGVSARVRKSIAAAPEGMFDPRNPRTRPQVHVVSRAPASLTGAIAQMASTLTNKIALYSETWSDKENGWKPNHPTEMLDSIPHEFGHVVHGRANANKHAASRAGFMDYLASIGGVIGGGYRPRPGQGPGPAFFAGMSEMSPELGLYDAAKDIPGNRSIMDSIDAIGKRNTLKNSFFSGGHYEQNYGEMYAELFSNWVNSDMGRMQMVNVPEGANEYLRNLAAQQGWRSYVGTDASKLPALRGKASPPGYGLRPGNILYNNRAQAGIGSLLDIGQMAATGTLSAAGVAASAGLNAMSLIPKIGGPLSAVAGLGLTAATGGNVMRALFSTVGSIGGGLLGGLLGSFLAPGAGTVALGYGGSMAGGALGGSLYDLLFGGPGGSTVQGSFRKGAFEIPGRAWGGPVIPRPSGDNFTNFGDKGRTTGTMPADFLRRFQKYGQQGLYNTPWEKYIGGAYMPSYGNAVNVWWDKVNVAKAQPFSSLPKYWQLDEILSGNYLPPEFYSGNKNNLSYADLMKSRGMMYPGIVSGWMRTSAKRYWDRGARAENPEHAEWLKSNKLYEWYRTEGMLGGYKGYDDPYYTWKQHIDPKTGKLVDNWTGKRHRMNEKIQELIPSIASWMNAYAGPMVKGWMGDYWSLEQYEKSPWGKKMSGKWYSSMFGEGGYSNDIERMAIRMRQGWLGERYAAGGSYRPNSAFLVGERGPEIMVPGGIGGSIIPNHKLRGPGNIGSMASGQSVNASVVINNPTVSNGADIDKLAAKVSEAQTRALRAAGYVRPS